MSLVMYASSTVRNIARQGTVWIALTFIIHPDHAGGDVSSLAM